MKIRQIAAALVSVHLTIGLLIALLLICIVGSLVPQEGLMTHAQIRLWQDRHPTLSAVLSWLGGFQLFRSWLFLGVLAALWLNLLLCTWKTCHEFTFSWRWWTPPGAMWWGFTIIHIALLLSMAGIWINQKLGNVWPLIVKENTRLDDGSHNLSNSQIELPRLPLWHHVDIWVKKIHVGYQGLVLTKLACETVIQHRDGSVRTVAIETNRPWQYASYALMIQEYGFAPSFVLKNQETGWQTGPHANFLPVTPDPRKPVFFTLPQGVTWDIQFFPDAEDRQSPAFPEKSRSYELKNPVFILTLREGDNILGKQMLPYAPATSQPVSCQIGAYEISITRMEYWASFELSYNPGLYFVYFGMWLAILGLFIRYCRVIL